MNKFYCLIFTLLLFDFSAFSQVPTQRVRGKIVDSETQFPLTGVKIQIELNENNDGNLYRAISNADGEFEINKVPVGKHQLVASYTLYETKTITIQVSSGRETVVNVPMVEAVLTQEEVTVVGRKKGEVLNEMAILSAQQFSVEETNRYPGSRMDPARMASNFAGVGGADDSRNDIVVRGNSPLGVIYRVEGIDIPNPNHFAIAGSSGGPVSILNNKILGNSDFFMSAFPAEYGNSTSGVFDLKLRNGNNRQHEFTGQFGFLGTEALAEGPLDKNGKSSYLVMGRYSTLSLFQTLGIKIGTDAIPLYGDGAFKFNWQLKNGGQLSLFGIGGKSNIAIKISDQKQFSEEFYGEGDRDQYFGTSMFTTGINFKKPINEKTFISSTLAFSQENQNTNHEYIQGRQVDTLTNTILFDTIYPMMAYKFQIQKVSGYFALNHKLNKNHLIKAGLNFDVLNFVFNDSVLVDLDNPDVWKVRWNYNGYAAVLQPFVQWKWRPSEQLDVTAGLHAQYFTLSNSVSPAEPRVGIKYKMKGNQSVFAGGGMHSQVQPYYTYAYNVLPNQTNPNSNKNMGFSRSIHSGLGYEKFFQKGFSIRTEAYYQYLYQIPVSLAPSSFSMINVGSGFSRLFEDSLQNTGTGYNYGLEFTVQKYFDKSFFFLLTGTVFDSKYKGSDGITRNTSYNGNYIVNFLAGKEFKIGQKHVLGFGFKVTKGGGKRYGFVDLDATNASKEIIFKDSLFNERKFRDYFRMDFKISWRMEAKRATHEIGLDLVNLLNTKNLLSLAYNPAIRPQDISNPNYEPWVPKTQLGFLPIFYYKIDFKLAGKKE
ncbi:MAG: hypothetical protein RL264_381 [Bacteroidota bacterium]|jgi:hypothetical protein